jgi:hypothetical protein
VLLELLLEDLLVGEGGAAVDLADFYDLEIAFDFTCFFGV